ncbi:nucleotide exchange factor GrpE [Corynebacterium suicordis]|uniref:Protein GrpE n=1 Tax=Corynebacterium suicordis DSM 45110 TaxID=1121369 RepID=A0ABR9ZLG3_9CORY|nr:nucleotide exchange factor GrpE [Corynebacterium suicordis]MBF4554283.1 nucleotide exchange factor GrpE [Corynebacterium suicordis DSM 45110]MDR6276738.1 molecular chaperone GrpE [Corynebacterium suicordis]
MADTNWTDNPGDPGATDEETLDAREANDVNPVAPEVDAVDQELQDILAGEEADPVAAAEAVADEQEVAEEVAADAAGAGPEAAAAELDEVAQLQQQLDETTDDLKRLSAEYANYRRRVERDRAGVIAGAKAEVAEKLLPLMDDMQLAESHGDLTGPLKAANDKLQSVLAAIKVESFGAEGDEFNPELHEAVQDTSSGETKVLGTVLRKGYRLGDRILRTAMVIITD